MTVSHLQFCSRIDAEAMSPRSDWAVISLNEPNAFDGMARMVNGWHSVLKLSFDDTMPSRLYEENVVHMTETDAQQIVQFVRNLPSEVNGVLVHCRAGVSRSAAVAKWIAGEYRIPFDRSYDKFNTYVYKLLIAVGRTK